MLKRSARSPLLATLLVPMLLACSPASRTDQVNHQPDALAQSLIIATRDFCVPYVVDGASIAGLSQRSETTEVRYNVHGQEVVRYRFDNLPGAPEVTATQDGGCWIGMQEVPLSARPAVTAAFRNSLHLDGYTTSEANLVPGPHTLVVGESSAASEALSFSGCVHGERNAVIQMSGYGIVDVTSNQGALRDYGCVPRT